MKIELELPDKPEVHAISGTLNLDPDCVVGKLVRVWQWFDKHTVDGNAYGVTYSLLDRITGVTGFGEAMMFVGWMEQNDKTLTMPKFDRHTSASAKQRALTAKRVEKIRSKSVTPEALPREEKRREEKHTNPRTSPLQKLLDRGVDKQIAQDWLIIRKAKKAPLTETSIKQVELEAQKAGVSFANAVEICTKNNWSGFKASWDIKEAQQSKKAWE